MLARFFSFLLFFSSVAAFPILADEEKKDDFFAKGITVDLREPEYSEGILKTDEGGIITGPDMRIQARHIIYTRKIIDGKPVFTIEASGDLFIEFGEYAFVGARLEYDFQEKRGLSMTAAQV